MSHVKMIIIAFFNICFTLKVKFITSVVITGLLPGSIGREIAVYDSSFNGELSSSLTHQLALIYRSLVISKDNGEEVAPHLMVIVHQFSNRVGLTIAVYLQ